MKGDCSVAPGIITDREAIGTIRQAMCHCRTAWLLLGKSQYALRFVRQPIPRGALPLQLHESLMIDLKWLYQSESDRTSQSSGKAALGRPVPAFVSTPTRLSARSLSFLKYAKARYFDGSSKVSQVLLE